MKHTALPWSIEKIDDEYLSIYSSSELIADVIHAKGAKEDGNRNAKFIIRACNCHEELVEALKLVSPIARTLMDELAQKKATNWGIVNDGLVKINKALANATK